MKKNEVYFEGSYDPDHQCIKISGDGAAEIRFITDASQLASVLLSLAAMKGCCIGITLRRIPGRYPNGSEEKKTRTSGPKTYR